MLCSVCAGALFEHISLLGMRGPSKSVLRLELGCGQIRREIVPKLTPGGALRSSG